MQDLCHAQAADLTLQGQNSDPPPSKTHFELKENLLSAIQYRAYGTQWYSSDSICGRSWCPTHTSLFITIGGVNHLATEHMKLGTMGKQESGKSGVVKLKQALTTAVGNWCVGALP